MAGSGGGGDDAKVEVSAADAKVEADVGADAETEDAAEADSAADEGGEARACVARSCSIASMRACNEDEASTVSAGSIGVCASSPEERSGDVLSDGGMGETGNPLSAPAALATDRLVSSV